ncbi:MAG: anaerobic ribonucleoside-triphosphate reductase activating protein [Victivallales bacterium]|nr:anaerobic ribonucleoside-triphosphate reductase activating protein [Victivallales bacterium]
MDIRGLIKFSLVDFPGRISCVVFVAGCNFRCPFCHNPYLVLYQETQPPLNEGRLFKFLGSRSGRLDGVVISGGEPCLQKGLEDFARTVKEMGFEVKLDTNGSRPERAMEMCRQNLVDMLGIDYKAARESYGDVTGTEEGRGAAEKVVKLISFAVANGIPCDIRTTVHRKLHTKEHLAKMRRELDSMGVAGWTLQQFHRTEIVDESLLEFDTYTDTELSGIAIALGGKTSVRGLAGH